MFFVFFLFVALLLDRQRRAKKPDKVKAPQQQQSSNVDTEALKKRLEEKEAALRVYEERLEKMIADLCNEEMEDWDSRVDPKFTWGTNENLLDLLLCFYSNLCLVRLIGSDVEMEILAIEAIFACLKSAIRPGEQTIFRFTPGRRCKPLSFLYI